MRTPFVRQRRTGFLARLRDDARGTVLVMSVTALGVLIGGAALAIDLGMLITARTQSQRAADAGALAGAMMLADPAGTEEGAREKAMEFANKHRVMGHDANVADADVDVIISESKVRVRVKHTLPTLFARIFGVDEMDVSTVGAARAAPAAGVSCPLPIAVLDDWDDLDGDGEYDPGEPYTACNGSGACTGYELNGHGELIEVKTQPSNGNGNNGNNGNNNGEEDGGGTPGVDQTCLAQGSPGWFCWIRPQNAPGSATVLRDIIEGCGSWDLEVSVGHPVHAASGNIESVLNDLADYIDYNDPDHHWDGGQQCIADATGTCVEHSLRIRGIPLVDPSSPVSSGNNVEATTTNVAAAFLEKVASGPDEAHRGGPSGQWNLYVRLLQAHAGGTGIGTNEETLLRRIVLVE